jgi:hypothetical protein
MASSGIEVDQHCPVVHVSKVRGVRRRCRSDDGTKCDAPFDMCSSRKHKHSVFVVRSKNKHNKYERAKRHRELRRLCKARKEAHTTFSPGLFLFP